MRLIILMFCTVITFLSCSEGFIKNQKEIRTLKEIILLRTEGVILLENYIALRSNQEEENGNMISEIKRFYSETQQPLVDLCVRKPLDLSLNQYFMISEQIEVTMADTINAPHILVENLLVNFNKQKMFYFQVLQDPRLSTLHSFVLNSYLEINKIIGAIQDPLSSRINILKSGF
ncbi:hypothetical protein ACFRAE_08740 [Sphingobacterium sp. HJSM2_6]|uniref:hypothetical protein n=1 Tax=Sphingobacterium sp. HJSM2_6 TaxID=3366264 RepID=UPI003BC6A534